MASSFLDTKHVDGPDGSSRDASEPSTANHEAEAEPRSAADTAAEAADPDPAQLQREIGWPARLPEDDVEHRIWELTEGRSGKPPQILKAEKKERKERRKDGERLNKGEPVKEDEDASGMVAELVERFKVKKDVSKARVGQGMDKKEAWRPKMGRGMDKKEAWRVQKEALKEKFGEAGWQPRKKLSPDALDGIRSLHKSDPDKYTTPVLANEFKVSPEAIRRILRAKWKPTEEEEEARAARWEKRGEQIWNKHAEMGVKPPKKWREMGVGSVKGGKDFKPAWKRGSTRGRDKDMNQRDGAQRPRDPGPDFGGEDSWSDRIF